MTEKALKISEEKFRFLFENSPCAIILMDINGRIRDVNPALEEMLKCQKEELINKTYSELNLIDPWYKPVLLNRLKKVAVGESIPPIDIQLKKTDGKKIWVNIHSALFELNGEKLIQTNGHDITEQKFAQEKLKKSEEKYREAYKTINFYKDLFVHDMNNILHSISSSLELYDFYLDRPESYEEPEKVLNIIKEQTLRGARLIENVRTLSKLETSQFPIKKINAIDILIDAIDFVNKSFPNKEIKIQIDTQENEYYVKANELLLDVLENLLINSVKHNLNKKIIIMVKLNQIKKKSDSYLEIQIIDNGIGIEDSRKNKIFESTQGKNDSIRGMGLGLSLVKNIIDNYKGFIKVIDRIDGDYKKGTNIMIYIPTFK
ncbi:MAG: PAS domain S-box protein [Candidatus Lokiarchaeota archaeon]|nr:PAS domain S-box protein [Candidatus Lokiarchaeota archaeon]MBD3338705.1 PAS domain S-box protein [Candidatus Lokiarchaeota archaeon]